MRYVLTTVCLVALLLGGAYWYRTVHSTCAIPLSFSIGIIDPRFELSMEEARLIVSEVESQWENATERNLFTYDPDAKFVVNFVYDDRQRLTDEELALREVLDRKEDIRSTIQSEYGELLDEYETLRVQYEKRVAVYEDALAVHNGEVAKWNTEGGAPPPVYERLNKEQKQLNIEQKELKTIASTINVLVDKMNTLGDTGNRTVRDYNSDVALYNDRFNIEREFTQGDYRNGNINIYQFEDKEELALVLAHEFGHALSLHHVEGEASVMYYLMGEQSPKLTFSAEDINEFLRVCGEG